MITTPILILPGLGNSGPDHWQSLWEAADPAIRRVVQRDWNRPDPAEWLETLHRHIIGREAPPVLVAHSLGCTLVAHYAKNLAHPIKGALLVSPSDVDSPAHTPDEARGFSPMPLARFSFPSIVVASTNDPYVELERAKFFAERWDSRWVTILGDHKGRRPPQRRFRIGRLAGRQEIAQRVAKPMTRCILTSPRRESEFRQSQERRPAL